ncbi:MAG: sulfatase-like hydrolase/transferase, partial [Chloroflexota bacterium]
MTTRAGGSRRPNIILVMADDLGYECLGSYGSQSYSTPNLDRLARQGMRFTNAHAQPLCTPTRVQLMTGKYNFRNWQAFGVMHPGERTFGHIMSASGYRTCISGKWQLYSYNPPEYEPEWRGKGQHPRDAGFHEYFLWHAEHTEDKGSRYADPKILDNGNYLQPPETSGQHGADLFAAYINDFIYRNRDQPFFVYYPMALTHAPFQPTPHTRGWPDNRHDMDPKYFRDMVEYHDEVIGRIVRQIDELRLAEDTLFIYYSDNGSPREVWTRVNGHDMQGGKGVNADAGTHVPLIARWPGKI